MRIEYVKEKSKYPSTRSLKAKLWTLVSIYIRSKDADDKGYTRCFTCGAWKPWKELDCGHFKHNRLDYDERNLKPQCTKCNKWERGKLDVYGIKLVEKHGLAWVQKLEHDARKETHYTPAELTLLIKHYQKLNDSVRNNFRSPSSP